MDHYELQNKKNMNYRNLWERVFRELGTTSLSEITSWENRSDNVIPFKLYYLPHGTIPSVETLQLQKPCSRRLPVSRAFDDKVLITVVFVTKPGEHNIFCAYTTSFRGYPIFCLWERSNSGIRLDPLDSAVFCSEYVTLTYREVRESTHVETPPSLEPTPVETGHVLLSDATRKVIHRSDCVFITECHFSEEEYVSGSDDWEELQHIFRELIDEFDGIAAAIVQNNGCGEYKSDYLYLKSLWTKSVEYASSRDLPILMCQSLYNAIWLYVCGCPGVITEAEMLALHISRIVHNFESEEVDPSCFISAMEERGFRRPFSRLVASSLTDGFGFDFFETIKGFCNPPSINSYLCKIPNEELAYFQSYIVQDEKENVVTRTSPELCHISVLGESDVHPTLLACALEMDNKDWSPADFTKDTYARIQKLLTENEGCVVLGHVTSEQSVIDMCCRDDENPNEIELRGLSIWVSNKNKTTCGRGMYFFRMSSAKRTFEELAYGGGSEADLEHIEFQSFLYGLTRAFKNTDLCHLLSPAVLLFVVNQDFTDDFVDLVSVELPLLDDNGDGGCTCPPRYDGEFKVNDQVNSVTARDGASLLRYCFEDYTEDKVEKQNAVALRSGLVNFKDIRGYEANVSDGSKLSSILLDLKNVMAFEKKKQGIKV